MASTALVAGAGGFIGGHLVQRLLDNGDRVVGVDIKPLRQWRQAHTAAKNISADLMDPAQCLRLARGVDIIYHLAPKSAESATSPHGTGNVPHPPK
jgi:GDP-D-mannose 3', 5'-epimerase